VRKRQRERRRPQSHRPKPTNPFVVLPLENLSPDPADAYFTEGMHEEIIQTLSPRLGGLSVRSRPTALALKDTKEPLALIARRLGVAYALSGSLRRSGKNVRVSLSFEKPTTRVSCGRNGLSRNSKTVLRYRMRLPPRWPRPCACTPAPVGLRAQNS